MSIEISEISPNNEFTYRSHYSLSDIGLITDGVGFEVDALVNEDVLRLKALVLKRIQENKAILERQRNITSMRTNIDFLEEDSYRIAELHTEEILDRIRIINNSKGYIDTSFFYDIMTIYNLKRKDLELVMELILGGYSRLDIDTINFLNGK